jgi:pimeloyl-ACP methyl ester carboxylesterase
MGDVMRNWDEMIGGWRTSLMEAGDGAPVLLIHGSSIAVDARLTWFRLFDALSPGARVIAYDQPGFGRSAIPDDRRYLDRLERSAHAQALVEQLDLRNLTVIGHSEGGFIAARLALTKPDRVRRLVIVASGGASPALGDARDAHWMEASSRIYDYARRNVDEDTFVRSEGHLCYRADPAFEEILRANFRYAQQSGNAECFLRRVAASSTYAGYTTLQEKWLLPFLKDLRAPALLVWAGRDETVPVARGLALLDLMPRSEMHIFRDAGHWVMHEAPARFEALIRGFMEGPRCK